DTTPPVFDPGSLGPRTVVGSCGTAPLTFTFPTATDNAGPVTVTCGTVAGTSFGANTVTCTATDASGNVATTTITVNVLQPLRITFQEPLEDDNVADNVDTDADIINVFKVGQTIPHQVKLLACNGQDVTSTAAVTLKLAVSLSGTGGGTNVVNDVDDYT